MDPSHPVPAQRATDSDREAAADALRTAGADGRLTVEEMEHRLAAVFAAKTHPDLDAQLADLQGRQALASSNAARQPDSDDLGRDPPRRLRAPGGRLSGDHRDG
jgi:hypothetical protein